MHIEAPRQRIWVVDDSAVDAARVHRLLVAEHHVEVFHDSTQVLEQLTSQPPPDLLVLDLLMPDVSGIDVCRFLRSPERGLLELPILLLTAHSNTDQVVAGLSAGANDFLAKPFASEELRARISSLLRGRQLLARAQKAEAAVRALLANAPDAILAVDAGGIISYVNTEACRILEREPREVVGRPVAELVPGLVLRNIAVGPGESLLPLPDVEVGERIFSPTIRLLPSDDASNTTIALRDVTVHRRAEARRLDYYSIIAHDLRTPLSSLLLRLELAFRGKHGVLPASLLAELRRMEGSVRSLVTMINDFLELARLEGVGYKIDSEPVDIAAVVRATVEELRPLLQASGLQWKSVGAQSGALVIGDRKRLTQVLANLIGNALKFTPAGGTITTSVVISDDQVEVAVEDTGRGIPPEQQRTVFDRYVGLSAPERGGAGTGLGLMIVREIIEAHGGAVGVESGLGVGSRFWFRLPRYWRSAH
jgi:two-component system phosphate regulon sensor histidine kinase PhoR